MSSAAIDLKRHVRRALTVVFLFGGAATASSFVVRLDSAVVAQGTVVVEGSVKKVQHPTGGVVGALFVKEGQVVHQGELLLRLDDTATRANLGVIMNDLNSSQSRRSRLLSERARADEIVFSEDLLARAAKQPDVALILAGERQLFASRQVTIKGQKSQLEERIGQITEEAKGLVEQRKSVETQLRVANVEYTDLAELLSRGLAQRPRVTALQREIAANEGKLADVMARTASARGKVSEIELQVLQLDKDSLSEVAKELQEVDTRIGELQQKRINAEDQLKKIDIVAPASGKAHQLAVHTVGGVINPTEPLMLIVPENDRLIVEVRIAPQDIDQVTLGQSSRVKFMAFNRRTTPEVTGKLIRIAPDLIKEPQTGQSYFLAGIMVDTTELAKLEGLKLLPGMPAEAYLNTGERTLASYIVKPLEDQMGRAFRER
jgi:HlyD family secretion protein